MKVLGVNISHNCSFAVIENGILKEYYEEDRFNKIKHFRPPHPMFDNNYQYQVLQKFKNVNFDAVSISSCGIESICYEKLVIDNILKQIKCNDVKFYNHDHHIHHALCAFYFSNFNEALGVICDGGGEKLPRPRTLFRSVESIYHINKKEVKSLYQHYTNWGTDYFKIYYKVPMEEFHKINENTDLYLTNKLAGAVKYLNYTKMAGFKSHQEGQLMGIAAYKNKDVNLSKNILEIANKAQEETLEERIKLIEKAITYSDCKNIVLSGGYHLNCSNNFKLVKHFPKLNFFVDPIPYDGGTAVGAAYYYANFEN